MSSVDKTELETYYGNCHCAAFKFSVRLPRLKSGFTCNCSLCSKKGYIFAFPGPDAEFTIERGESVLKEYFSAGKSLSHKFCPTCGTGITSTVAGAPLSHNMGINVRTLTGVDPWALELQEINGKIFDPLYKPAKFTGRMPSIECEGLKLYTGGCYCGAITIALKTKPLPQCEVKQDNCSICLRNAYCFLYPSLSQVSIEGSENTTKYVFGRKMASQTFCNTCGVQVYTKILGPPKELVATWSEARRVMVAKKLDLCPTNLRALDGVEWDKLKITSEYDGADTPPQYIVT